MSPAPPDRICRWRPIDGAGLEHCHIRRGASGTTIRSVLVAPGYGLSYDLELDGAGCIRTAAIERTDGKALHLTADGRGSWREADGTARADLDGCIDIDIWPTPLTNALPIWRSTWIEHQPQQFAMAWVDGDEMTVRRDLQIYTRLDRHHFRFQGSNNFEQVLQVDDDGLVVNYPTLFTRA